MNHSFRTPEGAAIDSDSSELQECGYLPSGMLLIRRSALEQLYKKHEHIFDQGFRDTRWFQNIHGTGKEPVLDAFEGEDVHFSKLWRDLGGKMYVLANVKVGHVGEYVYRP